MRRVTNIQLNISVDERIPLRNSPSISEWYQSGIEEQRSLTLLAKPQSPSSKASSNGFGLKKSGFGLNKNGDASKKPSQEQSDQDDAPTPTQLTINESSEQLNKTFSIWAGWQHHQIRKWGTPTVFLGIGSVSLGNRNFGPLLLIPVRLVYGDQDVHFSLRPWPWRRQYVPTVKRILNRKAVDLPTIPPIIDDFDPGDWADDVRSAFVPHEDLSFEEKSWLVRVSYKRDIRKEKQRDDDQVKDSEPAIIPLSLDPIAPLRETVEPLPQAHRKVLDEVDHQQILWLQSSDHLARFEMIRDLILSSIAHQQNVLLLGTHNDELSYHWQRSKEYTLAPLLLPLFYGDSSAQFLERVTEIVDHNWGSNKKASSSLLSDKAINKAGEHIHAYQEALHATHGNLNYSPASLIEELVKLDHIPNLPVSIDKIKEVNKDDIDRWTRIGNEYAKLQAEDHNFDSFIWTDSALNTCTEDDLIEINEAFEHLIKIKDQLFSALLDAQEQTGLKLPSTPADIASWIQETEFYDSAPKLDEKQLRPDSLQHLDKGDRIISLLDKAQEYYQSVSSYFHDQILEEHLEGVVNRLRKQSLSPLRLLNYRFRKDISRLKRYRIDQESDDDVLFWEKLKDAKILKQIRKKLRNHNHEAQRLFDDSWQGVNSDLNELKRQYRWLKRFKQYTGGDNAANSLEIRNYVASLKRMTNEQKNKIRALQEQWSDQIVTCIEVAQLEDGSPLHDLRQQSWPEINKILKKRKRALQELPAWLEYQQVIAELDRPDLSDLIDKIEHHDQLSLSDWKNVLHKTVLKSLLEDAKNDRPILNEVSHKLISGNLDQLQNHRTSELNKQLSALIAEQIDRRKKVLEEKQVEAGLHVLQHELKKQRRLQSRERLLNQSHGTLKEFSPVWMLRYDQLDENKKWIQDFDQVIMLDPDQDEIDGVATSLAELDSWVIFHTDHHRSYQFDSYISNHQSDTQLEAEIQQDNSATSLEESDQPRPDLESPKEMADDESVLIDDILNEIESGESTLETPKEASDNDLGSSTEQISALKLRSLKLPEKRRHLPCYGWPQLAEETQKQTIQYLLDRCITTSDDQTNSKQPIIWTNPQVHQKLWEKICNNEQAFRYLQQQDSPHYQPQILSSALQTTSSLGGFTSSECIVHVPQIDTGSKAAPSFGFKKAKQKTETATLDQLPDIGELWEICGDQLTLVSRNQSNIDNYRNNWSIDYFPEEQQENHPIGKAIHDHLGQDWEIIPHHDHPFETAVISKQYDQLRFYIWSDLLQNTDYAYLPDYYDQLSRSDYQLIHFPSVFYPARIHEWLMSLQQILHEAIEDHEAFLREQEEQAEQAEIITREVQDGASASDAAPLDTQDEQTDETSTEQDQGPYDLPPGLKSYELPEEAQFPEAIDQSQSQLPNLKSILPSADYRLHEGQTLGNKMDFFDASDNEMQKLILDIVDVESPIHWRNLLRCVASYWQIQRVNQNVERVILRNIQQLSDRERLFLKDGCIYNDADFSFKLRDRSKTIEYHRADELPLDECETALYEILKERSPIKEQALLRAGASLLGFGQFDRMLEHQFRKALHHLGEQDVIAKGPKGYELAPSYQQ
ncbi:MAG: DUF3320 domain-containing protein [Bacteroidota bacterium]